MYDLNQLCRADKRLLELRKGNKVIGAKDYMLVFFITCFLPFVRPSIPQLKESEIHRAKKSQYRVLSEFEKYEGPLDLDFLAECKATVKQLYEQKESLKFNGKSMYLKMHDERLSKKAKKEEAFMQSLFEASKQSQGNIFWNQLPNNTVKFQNEHTFNSKFKRHRSTFGHFKRKVSLDRERIIGGSLNALNSIKMSRDAYNIPKEEDIEQITSHSPGPQGRFRFLKNNKYIQGMMSPKAENIFPPGQQIVKQVDHKRNASTGLIFNPRSRQPVANSTTVLPNLKKLSRN